jgi:hypothetical protein
MENICQELHLLFSNSNLFLHSFPFKKNLIPNNGVYILYQKGEVGHSCMRIVRVGTHTGDNQLLSRLKQHFLNPNKDRSIFRKNIGRCFLNKNNDPYLRIWEIDFTTKRAKEEKGYLRNFSKEQVLEEKISKYIQENFSFYCTKLDEKNKRLYFEERLVGTISRCMDCHSSTNWIGRFSAKPEIVDSGLWLVQGLYKEPLSRSDLSMLKKIIDETCKWETETMDSLT